MSFCNNCGKPLNASSAFCESCGSPVNKTDTTVPVDIKVDIVSHNTKLGIAIFMIFLICVDLLIIMFDPSVTSGGDLVRTLFACGLGYFLIGPWAAKIGKDHNRNPNYGFIWGSLLNLIGILIYWIWVKVSKDPPQPITI